MKEKEYLTVGKILSSWGVKGQVKVEALTDDPNRFKNLQEIAIDLAHGFIFYQVQSVFFLKQGFPVLKFKSIDTREEAEELKGYYIKVHRKDAVRLPKGHYFICDIIGLTVDNELGDSIGTVIDVLQTGANDIYVIEAKNKKELLIPAIKQVVKKIDIENGIMVIRPMEGMM